VTSIQERITIHDATTLAPQRTFPDAMTGRIALGADDRTLLVGRRDGRVEFLDLRSGVRRRPQRGHQGAVLHAAFSADGKVAATAGRDNRILLWDPSRRTVTETFTGHEARITGLGFTPDARTLYSGGLDGKIMLWDLTGERRLARPFRLADDAAGPALSPDGQTLAVADGGGTIALTDVRTLRTRTLRIGLALGGIAYLRDGQLLGSTRDGFGVVVDAATGELGARHRELASVQPPSLDSARRRLALVRRGAALVQPLSAGGVAGRARYYRRAGGALNAALSPDGRSLAVTTNEGIEIVDVARMRIRSFLPESATAVAQPAFSPDGRVLAAGSREGWVRLFSTTTWKPVSPKLAAHSGGVHALTISPNGRILASGGKDGTVRLFDLPSRQPFGAPLTGLPASPATPRFSPDSAFLFAVTDGAGLRWDLRAAAWERHACKVAGRPLTRAEWADALPGREYAPACRR
jgi:WD40 repeat protein